ncbi:transcription factor HIVEP2-like [Acipenser ruthenus]|uniref:transcription factor HIVEP2-like n=1 Tax=Acipenser ruthenus TaxID=7906 RepID=UPI002742378E|nr:transcription factor HIVEP2-like [Acipenser ruthenus]XP_033873749.3 transcription factor HIVEP2-like [Acipenser ruthenus]XP_033873751.3 transcription factor HIVEP2-like [Acipenser ruthenus]XP_058881213.1 transcription factor HIVEP2-like [Acipenser ruthenus]
MEPIESATGQKSTKEPREKNQLQRKWGSEPSAGTKRSTFADPGKRHSHCDAVQSSSPGSAQKYVSGKLQISTAVGQHPQEKQYPQHFPSTYSYQLPHSFSQQSIPQRFLQNAKPQPNLEAHAWQFPNQLQSVASEDLFSMHARSHGGVFPQRKSHSLPAAYNQYSQSGMEQPEEIHKKEQKPKKPGKYICHYCGRACAKPSVLKKHIRSHTGERPYPCVPCGFSFKTKSNLYKHRKSHAHAIKAGLVPYSDLVSARSDMEQASSFGEAEVHSDGEQSTDTEEETALSAESSPAPHISFKVDKSTMEKSDELIYVDMAEELAVATMKVPILIVPKSGIQPVSECSQFLEIEASQNPVLVCRDESHTIKQRLAMRLSEKRGHDSEQSLNLLSPHSKGSTDSGYFSRSESAEQQISPPNTNAKSYEEIMFGKYYKLNPRTAVTVVMAVEGQDTNVMDIKEKSGDATSKFGITKIIKDHISQLITDNETVVDPSKQSTIKLKPFSRGESSESQMLTGLDAKQYPAGSCQSKLLEPPSDAGSLVRSNSMPTPTASNLNVPQGLRGSHSFDERIASDDVFYPGTAGLSHRSMLRRQAAFELSSAHEGHSESENYVNISKNTVPPSGRVKLGEINRVVSDNKVQIGERSMFECELCGASYRRWEELETHRLLPCPEMHGKYRAFGLNLGAESCSEIFTQTQIMQHKQATETATRKRRKEKSVGDDEDLPGQYSSDHGTSVEMLVSTGDYDSKPVNLEATRASPCVKAHNFSVHSQSDSFETGGTLLTSGIMTPEDVVLVPVSEKEASNRKNVGNVISVIQHTNSLSRPSSFEKSESIEHVSYQQDKSLTQHPNLSRDQSDSENIEEVHSPETAQQESMEQQQSDGTSSTQPQSHQQYHMPPRLVRQPNIQVPEIRVTEEPDKPEKEPVIQIKEPEKPVEEFQWPQRSETLSQLPAEKLPPKKKRLRLADMDHSSGESSFESNCTSLSRSPSQESNLSHSSSFSMSFDREENIKSVSPTKQDEFGKQSEFLTVPGSAHSLAIPSQHQQREMRRSSSEQAPCPLPTEVPEVRSKSFDYGYLSAASTPGDSYTCCSVRERRRGFLVRQASLSVYPEGAVQDQAIDQNIKQEHAEQLQGGHHSLHSAWHGSLSPGLHYGPAEDSAISKRGMPPNPGLHHAIQLSMSEETQQEGHSLIYKTTYLPSQHPTENDQQAQEVMQYPPFHNLPPFPASPLQQAFFWQSQRFIQQHLALQTQQLQKLHIRLPNLQPLPQKSHSPHQLQQIQEQVDTKALDSVSDNKYQYISRASQQHLAYSTSSALLQQVQPIFATQNAGPQPSLPGMLVPVRIQTQVPSYGSVMYTNVSQILVTHAQSTSSKVVICKVSDNASQGTFSNNSAMQGIGLNLSQILGHPEGLLRYPLWKVPQPLPGRLDSGIPLCLTSGSISTTDASSNIGGSKRMLSPASSLELFVETKQQKRVKEEKMYGQIVEELSAVELNNSNVTKNNSKSQKPGLVRHKGTVEFKEGICSPSAVDFILSTTPSLKSVSHLKESMTIDSLSPPQQIPTNIPDGRESPEELDVDEAIPEISSSPQSFSSMSDIQEDTQLKQKSKIPVNMLMQLAANRGGAVGSTLLLTDVADAQQLFQFPSLRTNTSVSWCFLNYTKPNHAQTTPISSVYASWSISSYNPNPPNLSTKASLALLRSKQRQNTENYTMAALYKAGTGKLVSSITWKQKFDQVKPELAQLEVNKFEKKVKGSGTREREKGEYPGEKDVSTKQSEPTRIKIFEGGYKSNEDYIYVRGRGRGKYICEECGIRCKKPSMLKKHIRTHTDVRPYVCKFCNFAFKTKGNLTKHMKSKAHMKKCLELGVSVTSGDDVETDEADNTDDAQKESDMVEKSEVLAEHQFSDAYDSEGAEEEGDEIDDDDDEDDEYDGDSTPKTRSRSTSPQPCRFSSLPVTAAAASQKTQEILGPPSNPSLISYLVTLPSIQVTQLMAPSDKGGDAQVTEYQRLFQGAFSEPYKHRLDVPSSMDEGYMLSPEHSSSSRDLSPSRLSSPGCDSSLHRETSPTSRRYLSPRRDVSPHGHLSPRRDASPLRHLSPKREVSFRRELSPRRDLSPRRHLSPFSLGRPMSPGKEVSSRRELSPRSRHRAIIRAASPRRGSHHHNTSWSLGQYLQSELAPLGQRNRTQSEMDTSAGKGMSQAPDHFETQPGSHKPLNSTLSAGGHQGYLFSHLPLHSQQQIRVPFPMIPIGGIQMVHSIPSSVTGFVHSSMLPLQKSASEESSTSEVTYPVSESNIEGPDDFTKQQDKPVSPQLMASVISPVLSIPSLKETSWKTNEEIAEIIEKEKQQEESIQTCTKAIASLRIASVDIAPPETHMSLKVFDHHQKTLESAQLGIQHFSGSEDSHELACASATKPDSHTEKDNLSTSETVLAHSAFYSKSADERLLGQQGLTKLPTSTKIGKDLAREVLEKGKYH